MQPLDVSWLVRLRWAAAVLFLLLALAARAVFHIPVPLLAVGVVWGLQILTIVALGIRVRRHRTVGTTTVFALMALFAWALGASQFDDLQREGARILEDGADLDGDQPTP